MLHFGLWVTTSQNKISRNLKLVLRNKYRYMGYSGSTVDVIVVELHDQLQVDVLRSDEWLEQSNIRDVVIALLQLEILDRRSSHILWSVNLKLNQNCILPQNLLNVKKSFKFRPDILEVFNTQHNKRRNDKKKLEYGFINFALTKS